jgi:hypothetical protein
MATARIDPKVGPDNEPGTNVLQAAAITVLPAMRNEKLWRLSDMRGQLSKQCAQDLNRHPDDER